MNSNFHQSIAHLFPPFFAFQIRPFTHKMVQKWIIHGFKEWKKRFVRLFARMCRGRSTPGSSGPLPIVFLLLQDLLPSSFGFYSFEGPFHLLLISILLSPGFFRLQQLFQLFAVDPSGLGEFFRITMPAHEVSVIVVRLRTFPTNRTSQRRPRNTQMIIFLVILKKKKKIQ